MGTNLEFGVPSCGQFSLTATYAHVKNVDNRWVPVEQTKPQRYPRSGELDSDPPAEPCRRPSGCRPLPLINAAGAELRGQ